MLHIAPVHLTGLCFPVSMQHGRANLRSTARGDLSVGENKGTTCGSRSFASSGNTTRNTFSLSNNISVSDTFAVASRRNHLLEHITEKSIISKFYDCITNTTNWCRFIGVWKISRFFLKIALLFGSENSTNMFSLVPSALRILAIAHLYASQLSTINRTVTSN